MNGEGRVRITHDVFFLRGSPFGILYLMQFICVFAGLAGPVALMVGQHGELGDSTLAKEAC